MPETVPLCVVVPDTLEVSDGVCVKLAVREAVADCVCDADCVAVSEPVPVIVNEDVPD